MRISDKWYRDVKVGDIIEFEDKKGKVFLGLIEKTDGDIGFVSLNGEHYWGLDCWKNDEYSGYTLKRVIRPLNRMALSSAFKGNIDSYETTKIYRAEHKVKEVTMAEIEAKFGMKVKVIK